MDDATLQSEQIMSLKELKSFHRVKSSPSKQPPQVMEFFRQLNRLRMKGTFCDALLMTEDGGSFRVHKTAMSCCSNYFRTLFTTTLSNKPSGEDPSPRTYYLIPNVSSTILENLVQFAYSEIVDVNVDNVNELLRDASQFDVPGVVEECIDFMIQNMTNENCLGVWRFGKDYFMPRLENEAYKYILHRFVDISLYSEEFLHLQPILLKTILKNDTLNAPNELFVWIALKRWCQYKYNKRLRFIPRLLPTVRLALLTIHDFRQIMDDPRIFTHACCRNYINMVSKYVLNEIQDLSRIGSDKRAILMFTPRRPNEVVLASGGWTISGPTNIIEVYDCRADLWKMMIYLQDFAPRAYHKTLCMDNYVYIFGGSTGDIALNTCWRFDTSSLRFEEIAPMQEMRCFLSATVLSHKIYAIGGFDGYERLRTVEYYDHSQNQWIYVSPMQEKRSDASASSLRNRIFVVGGFNGGDFLQSAECYHAEFDQWLYLPPMDNCRSGVGCVAIDNAIYAIGGFNGMRRLNSVEKYCMFQRQWFPIKPMKSPRSNFATAILEKKIHVFGGYNDIHDVTTDQSECFDPVYHRWCPIAPLNVGRSGLSTCTFSGLRDVTPYIKDNRFRCLLKNVSKEEVIDIDAVEDGADGNGDVVV